MTDIVNKPAPPILTAKAVDGTRLDLHAPGCGLDCPDATSCDACYGPTCFTHDDGDHYREPTPWRDERGNHQGYDHRHCST